MVFRKPTCEIQAWVISSSWENFFYPELRPRERISSFFFFKDLFIYLFMAVLGLRFCARAFSSCGKRGPLLIAVRGPLTIAASLVAEHRLQMCRLINCGSRAQLLRDMWDLPRPGFEPVSPALAGRFSTTAPPGKPKRISSLSTYNGGLFSRHRLNRGYSFWGYLLYERVAFTKHLFTLA